MAQSPAGEFSQTLSSATEKQIETLRKFTPKENTQKDSKENLLAANGGCFDIDKITVDGVKLSI